MNYSYSEFKQHLISDLQNHLDTNTHITIQDILKNNDTHLDGLTILSPASNLSPTLYLNHYYKAYQDGRSISEIKNDILKICRRNNSGANIDFSFFTDYDKVKTQIVFQLVNYKRNQELLQTVPHYRFLDLCIVFHCMVRVLSGTATILIHNQHLTNWGITQDDLYALAQQNTPRLLPFAFRDMSDILQELLSDEPPASAALDTAVSYPMYVLTNRQKLNGAGCILYQNLLRDFAHRLDSDLYLLPSSVHEILILPAKYSAAPEELSEMVRNVNSSQLSREEILSDHIYYFSRESGQITM